MNGTESYTGNWTHQPIFENQSATEIPYQDYEFRFETYLVPIIFGIIFIVGVLGNGTLVVVFLRHRAMRNVPNTYILSLALADLLVIITTVPFVSIVYTIDSWPWGESMCMVSEFVKDVSIGVSVFTLTALSSDRFFAIVDPLRKFHAHVEQSVWAIFYERLPFDNDPLYWNINMDQGVGPRRYKLSELVDWFHREMRKDEKLWGYYRYDLRYNPTFMLKVRVAEMIIPSFPIGDLHTERVEREYVTDDVIEGMPTLEDLGVNLTYMEDQVPWELRPFRALQYYDAELNEFEKPTLPKYVDVRGA